MNAGRGVRVGIALSVFALAGVAPTTGQIAEAVRSVEDGTVIFTYDLKPGVEICDRGIWTGDHRTAWRSPAERPRVCITDVAEVELEIRGGLVRDVEITRPGHEPDEPTRSVGHVEAREAVEYLLGLARDGATSNGAEEAIFPATIADADDVWRDLLVVARDRDVWHDVRKQALFWLGQEAADAATAELSGVALDDDEEQDVRDAAIFALSQRPSNQAIAALIEVARTAEQAESRRSAMFWLAQNEDERVVAFFEEVLLGRNR